ncbi:MAG: phage late control D family protein [Anaeromicrobium sp.]|uniref:contractile injection system protein, VgrG/Pvc8 family n=1 Tax=Anaeromicrobium sp. TaxID=1929132 RepID=UPI0025E673D3|nr:contractile injection system protein, VgrG/Pvc8 family [Anaeromicrobium sp.]MCT4595557.1 phage late control D family protein [Anaeromicrobium sp.]
MNENAIFYDRIGVLIQEAELQSIKNIKITNGINEHGKLEFKGIATEEIQDIHLIEGETPIKIYYYNDEEDEECLFYGIITRIKKEIIGGLYNLDVEAKSYTYFMDISKKSRSFQNIKMTSHQLIEEVIEGYDSSKYKIKIPNEPIGELVLQYEETDWEFLKRFASRYSAGLFPEITVQNIRYFIGTPDFLADSEYKVNNYIKHENLHKYEDVKANHKEDVKKEECISYEIEIFQVLKLGAYMEIKGIDDFRGTLYVSSVEHELKDGILHNKYILKTKKGLEQRNIYNNIIIKS